MGWGPQVLQKEAQRATKWANPFWPRGQKRKSKLGVGSGQAGRVLSKTVVRP